MGATYNLHTLPIMILLYRIEVEYLYTKNSRLNVDKTCRYNLQMFHQAYQDRIVRSEAYL